MAHRLRVSSVVRVRDGASLNRLEGGVYFKGRLSIVWGALSMLKGTEQQLRGRWEPYVMDVSGTVTANIAVWTDVYLTGQCRTECVKAKDCSCGFAYRYSHNTCKRTHAHKHRGTRTCTHTKPWV